MTTKVRTDFFKDYPRVTTDVGFIPTSNIIANPNELKETSFGLEVIDLFVRFSVRDSVILNATSYYEYIWQDTDTPNLVAKKYYGSESYYWVVYFSNNVFDYQQFVPMKEEELVSYLIAKYASEVYPSKTPEELNTLTTNEKQAVINYTKTTMLGYRSEEGFFIDQAEYATGRWSTATPISIEDFEREKNEAKRRVKLLKKEFLSKIIEEFTTKIKARRSS